MAGRANKMETVRYEEIKEYSDAYTQHELSDFTTISQTQTDPEPKVLTASFSIQTDPEPSPPPKVTIEVEIQTEPETEPEPSRSPSPDEAMASSSSTVLPPTPKPALDNLHPDLPPSYTTVTEDEQKWRVAAETLKHWHHGINVPFEPVEGGVSEEVIEQWKVLQDELGIGCMVVDKVIATSEKRRPAKDGKRHSKFYNIYNTYVYGQGKDGPSSIPWSQLAMCCGVTCITLVTLSPFLIPQQYFVPGSPTYHDRSAWTAFNTMGPGGDGFTTDGGASLWNFLGGAARMARGWPT